MPDSEELVVCERAGICDRKTEHCCSVPHTDSLSCYTKGDPMYSCCNDGIVPNKNKMCRPIGYVVAIKDERPA